MLTKQISIFLENKPGRLAGICRSLAAEGINIAALSLADSADFGIARMIVDDHVKGCEVLSRAGFAVIQNEVVVAKVSDRPGAMAELMEKFDKAGVDIKYSYAYALGSGDAAVLVFRFDDNLKAEAAIKEP
jgi:hypothetical protein